MSATDRPKVFVHPLPSLIAPGSLRGGVAVVVDVLRATTVMVHALANGCESVIPCSEIQDAQVWASHLPPGTALLGGERGGLPIPGFDLGNSPGDYNREVCDGKTLVMTTTNGTRAIVASLEAGADRLYIASFNNLTATAEELVVQFLKKDHGHPIHIVCAGTEGFISLEDSLLAGAIVASLTRGTVPEPGEASRLGNDAALIVLLQWLGASHAFGERPLADLLKSGRGGQNVIRIGLEEDIKVAAEVDRFSIVAELRDDMASIAKV
jgi:2-phosphosulfolactate phosphatase